MKWIEHRRHALRTKPSPHLNREGVRTARELGDRISRQGDHPGFARVVTSPKKRAMETALAMGFAIDETSKTLRDLPSALTSISHDEADFASLYSAWQEASHSRSAIEKALQKYRDFLSSELEKIGDGEKLLLVSHGGIVEWTTIAALGEASSELGEAIDKCDAVEIAYHAGEFQSARAIRDSSV